MLGDSEEEVEPFCDRGDYFGGRCAGERCASCEPSHGTRMVRQHHPTHGEASRQRNFERVTFCRTRNRADEGKPCPRVVFLAGQDNSRPVSGLLVAGYGIEIDPDDVTALRNV
jgi:hypothetical protein